MRMRKRQGQTKTNINGFIQELRGTGVLMRLDLTGSIVANLELTPATITIVTNRTMHEDERMEEKEEVTEDPLDPKWMNLFTKNRVAANGLNLDYISPKLGRDSLRQIDIVVGKPIYVDECTAKQTRISFARMLIEVNITNPLPNEITVLEPNGRQIQQEIQNAAQKRHHNGKKVAQESIIPAIPAPSYPTKENVSQMNIPVQSPPLMVQTSHEFNLTNFPALCSVPMKNGFGSLVRKTGEESGLGKIPPEKGGPLNTI
ncbi:hypothetical protein RDI58_010930 [Solanum bulbocastanum]|uniref:Uncharacterized protein n=1 Tax=Solanum bulbocastanum TaxID=147425 RepID=A0AAN8TQC5_SOLBU